jgi:hypothetical protein
METRTINIALQEQTPRVRKLKFLPDVTGSTELLLQKYYTTTTNASGVGSIDLPVKPSGTIRWRVALPSDSGMQTKTFYLSAGDDVDLGDLVAAGGAATQTVLDYVDSLELADISDVALTDLADGDALIYDEATDKWINGAGGGGGGASNLNGLSDVVITSAASGEFLRHNGTNWVDGAIQAGDIPTGVDADKISDASAVNKFVTAAEKTKLSNLSGTNSGDEDAASIKSKLGITTLSGSNTGDQISIVGITGTTAEFNTANTDGDFATLAGSETLTNKTLTSPAITTPTGIVKGDVGLGNVDNTSDATKNAASATLTNKTLTAPVINSPTGITKTDVGLSNVDNTADTAKPVSTAQQTALDLKANLASPTFTGTVSGVTKSMVGLGNVDNTSDANKPISTLTQTALDAKQATLVSATNIKTINSTSLLGSGDIAISGSVSDGDKGDITVSSSGTVWTVDNLVTSAITYYVCPTGQTTANYDGDGLNTAVTPSDSNSGLTKALPLATIAAAVAKIAGKVLLAPVTIQLADTDATKAYFPDEVEITNICAGAPSSSILERAITGRVDTYPQAYVYIKGNTSTPNNVNVTGAATYNGTTSTKDCAFLVRGSTLRVQGIKLNYFRAANGDTGAINGYRSLIYGETVNCTSDHTGNDGHLISGFDHSKILLGGSFNVTNSGFVSAHGGSTWQTYSPLGYASGTLSKSGTGFMMFANEHSHGMFEGGAWVFSGSGAYYAQSAWTHSSINWNGDAATTIQYNGASLTGLYASQGSVINEGAGVNMVVTLTSILRRAIARNGSTVSYGGTTAGSSADTCDGGSFINNGTFPFPTKRTSTLEGYQDFKEISAPATPASNEGRLYVKDVAGVTNLFYKDDGGTEWQVSNRSALTETLTNKTIAFGSNTVSGTLAQFNTAVTDADLARTDAANTFTGTQVFSSAPTFSTMTAGSILFAGTSGALTQDNANIFFDDTNNCLNLGESSRTDARLSVFQGTSLTYGVNLRNEGQQGRFNFDVASSTQTFHCPVFNSNRARGTLASKSAAASGDDLFQINVNIQGDSTTSNTGVRLKMVADGTPSATSAPAKFTIMTTPSGATSPVDRIVVNNVGITSLYKGADVASASTITPTGNLFHVTGTTNITSVSATGITAGTEITIIFDGALTFTDGGNLKLSGNFVTTADDVIKLVYDGTSWFEVSRSSN